MRQQTKSSNLESCFIHGAEAIADCLVLPLIMRVNPFHKQD